MSDRETQMARNIGSRNHHRTTATLRLLARPFGNAIGQRALESITKGLLFMMGVGAGSGVRTSGEREVLLKAQETAREGEPFVVFDVGANRGDYITLALETSQLRPVVIHAFEPSRIAFENLCSRWGSRDEVVLNRLGLGKSRGMCSLYADAPGSTLASLSKRDLRHVGLAMNYSEEVLVETLDSYCLATQVHTIDVLKVDVEGHELEVFKGAEGLLKVGAVRMATFEFGGTHIDSRLYLRDFFYFFRDHGMELYRIAPSGYVTKIDRYTEFCEQFRATNYLAMNRNT